MSGWAGFPKVRTLVMGALNVTPDSFSDGGDHYDADTAIAAGQAMLAAGADIVDIGGESTRPGARPVPPADEQARILPVIRALAHDGALSVDTRNAGTMQAALAAGVRIVNDVSGLTHDPLAARVVAEAGCPVILMHMRGTPRTMARLTDYGDVIGDVHAALAERVRAAEAAGIARTAIALDPGLGFAKTAQQSLRLLSQLQRLLALGLPLVVGASRKSFIGGIVDQADPRARDPGSLAAHVWAALHGATVVRTHDVPGTVQALAVLRALQAEAGTADGVRTSTRADSTA